MKTKEQIKDAYVERFAGHTIVSMLGVFETGYRLGYTDGAEEARPKAIIPDILDRLTSTTEFMRLCGKPVARVYLGEKEQAEVKAILGHFPPYHNGVELLAVTAKSHYAIH